MLKTHDFRSFHPLYLNCSIKKVDNMGYHVVYLYHIITHAVAVGWILYFHNNRYYYRTSLCLGDDIFCYAVLYVRLECAPVEDFPFDSPFQCV